MSVHRKNPDRAVEAVRETIAQSMTEARQRTMTLIEPLSDEDLLAQHDPLMSPIIWDIGHIAHFEELWLTRNLEGKIEFSEMPGIYNPFENPRAVRGTLPLKPRAQMLGELERIREAVLKRLSDVEFDDSNPLLRFGYVYNMVLQHEYQHNETILQTLQLKQGEPYAAPRKIYFPVSEPPEATMVAVDGGRVSIGTNDVAVAYDNERPNHFVEVMPFQIDATPVTNSAFMEFMNDGGYTRLELWSEAGRKWLLEGEIKSPKHWVERDGAWLQRVFDRTRLVDPSRPVCHVCYYEADAYARWAGKRLPTEFEWECAASWDAGSKQPALFPWGDSAPTPDTCNIDQLAFDTAPVRTFRAFASPAGCVAMIGDVWEWTSSDFHGYPGFTPFPYPEYSEVSFGTESKVLRGGSWATRPGAIRNTFRNWDYPIRRQIFAGFRCAKDV
ncbi:MAG: ergothioneine biosynthesis protein EgtB [Gemmatimonadaceae bacterium]|nr:ergothioneine biosynthesis protein EgtB [Gemmatimonadaceae bacterium]